MLSKFSHGDNLDWSKNVLESIEDFLTVKSNICINRNQHGKYCLIRGLNIFLNRRIWFAILNRYSKK